MNQPLISVIVPVYGAEKFLDQCVQSLVAQTYQNLEILLVDDGSPDNSGAMCDIWAEKDPRIRAIHKENGGTGTARNMALDIARGELIAFLDNDDYISPDMYQHLQSLMDDRTDLVECGFMEVYEDGVSFPEGPADIQWYSREDSMRLHIGDNVFRQVIWNKLYRREVIGQIRFPAGITMDDEYFTYRVLGSVRGAIHSNKVCHAYRQQPESITHKPYSMKRLTGIQAKMGRLQYLKEHMPQLVEDAERNLYFTCMYAMQMSMLAFTGEELKKAKAVIRDIMDQIHPPRINKGGSIKGNLWIVLSRISFEGTCALRNYLFERK